MYSLYFTFLYNECKRLSTESVDINQINKFILSPIGQKGFKSFCKMRGISDKTTIKTKSVSDVLTGLAI